VIPRGSAHRQHHQHHQNYQIRQENQVKRHFSEENVFRKTATAARTENKNKQEQSTNEVQNVRTRAAEERQT